MSGKGLSTKTKAWFVVLLALLDDIIALGLIILILWIFDIEISIPVIIILAVGAGAFIFIVHRAVVPAIVRRKMSGAEGMVGMTGEVTERLCPKGTIKIKGEYWKAVCNEGDVSTGEEVEVLRITGLKLEVRKKINE